MARTISADKAAKNAAKIAIAAQATEYLQASNVLAEQNKLYEQDRSNCRQKRYAVVAGIMQLYEKIAAHADCEKIAKQLRSEIKATQEVSMQAKSSLVLVATRLVVRGKEAKARKTAHLYARVIEVAVKHNVTSAELVSFINKYEGLNKVADMHVKKRKGNTAGAERVVAASTMREALHERSALATFALSANNEELLTDKNALNKDLVYFVCKFENGAYKVLDAVLVEEAAEQQLLAKLAKANDAVAANDSNVKAA